MCALHLEHPAVCLRNKNGYLLGIRRIRRNLSGWGGGTPYLLGATFRLRLFGNPSLYGQVSSVDSISKNITTGLLQKLGGVLDRKGRIQAPMSAIREIDSTILNEHNANLPNKAVGIFEIKPNLAYILSRLLKLNNIRHEVSSHRDKHKGKTLINNYVCVKNGFFSDKIARQLSDDVGLSLNKVLYIFTIHSDTFNKHNIATLNSIFGEKNICGNSIILSVYPTESANFFLRDNQQEDREVLWDAEWDTDWNFLCTLHKRRFDRLFGAGNYDFEYEFRYWYDTCKYETSFLPNRSYSKEDLWSCIYNAKTSYSTSLNEERGMFAVDFNWREESLEKAICNVANEIGVFIFSYYQNHKCNIDLSIEDIDLKNIEEQLKSKFPSIRINIDNRSNTLHFYQDYTLETKSRIHKMLCSEINDFEGDISVDFERNLSSENLYFYEVDKDSQVETIQSRIKELRGSEFTAEGRGLGKLVRTRYPYLEFDISELDVLYVEQLTSHNCTIHSVSPNLTGDIEKMYRLKDSFQRIVSGDGLNNAKLSEYIFDSSKAKPIPAEGLKYNLCQNSDYYKDIKVHLLNKNINNSQIEAVIKTLLFEDIALIQGPPGTGKSTAIAEIVWQHIRQNQQKRILLTSETNLAVDNAINKVKNQYNNLVKPIRFGDNERLEAEGLQFSGDAMTSWVESDENRSTNVVLSDWMNNIASRADISDSCIRDIWLDIMRNPNKEQRTWFFNSYIKHCNLIGATCSSIGDFNSENKPTKFYRSYCRVFGSKKTYKDKLTGEERVIYIMPNGENLKFDVVIQDEASKATPAELSLPLIYGNKAIVIGDHRQLPPMLDKDGFISALEYLLAKSDKAKERKKLTELLKYIRSNFDDLELSHFERLFNDIDISLKGLFNLQYRMHPDINDVIKQFYIKDDGLECGLISPIDLGVNDPDMSNPASRYHGINIDGFISDKTHVIWIDTQSPELLDGTSRINYGEVEAIRWVLSQLQMSDSYNQHQNFWKNEEDKQLGIISFYGKQLKLLEEVKNEYPNIPMRISTVDRFQGMERNIVIVSMVRSNRIANDKSQLPDTGLYGDLGYLPQKDMGFAKSPNRLNVALSRAKRLLIIVGNSDLFRQNEIYNNVYKVIENNPNGRIIKYNHYDR